MILDLARSSGKLRRRSSEPGVVGQAIGAKLFEHPLLFAVKQASMPAQLGRHRRIDERARIVAAHLERDAHLELAKCWAIPHAVQIIDRVAPGQTMHATGW